jgi:plastocyanin
MGTFRLIGLGMVIGLITGGVLLAGCSTAVNPSSMLSPNNGGMMSGSGSMMGGQGGMGSMMGQRRSQGVPTAAPDDNRPVDQTIALVAQNLRYQPSRIDVTAGQTVRFLITNRDGFAHNFVSAEAGIGERVIDGGATQSMIWTAPSRQGTYRAQCTYHPGMVLDIVVS